MDKLIQNRSHEMNELFIDYNNHFDETSGLNILRNEILPNLTIMQSELKSQLAFNDSELLYKRLSGVESAIIYLKSLIYEIEQCGD